MRANAAECLFEPLVLHTWSGLPSKGTSRSLLNTLFSKIADNHSALDRQIKIEEMTQGLSCIIAAQVAEQIAAAIGPWEIPVMPAMDIPLRVDEQGNGLLGLGQPAKDTYAELRRRTRRKANAGANGGYAHPLHSFRPPAEADTPMATVGNSHTLFSSGPLPVAAPVIGPQYHPQDPSTPRNHDAVRSSASHNIGTTDSPTGDPEADALVRQLCDFDMSLAVTNNEWTPMSSPEILPPDHSTLFASTADLLTALSRALGEEPLQTSSIDHGEIPIPPNISGPEKDTAPAQRPHPEDTVGTVSDPFDTSSQEPRRSRRLRHSGPKPTRTA